MYPILSEEQYKTLDSLMSDEEITKFLEKFWKDNDPTPATDKNELREEFMRRLEYANFWFPDRRGWGRSDRKKIYLVYGPPFDIERYEFTGLEYGLSTKIKSLEIQYYGTPGKNTAFPIYAEDISPSEKKFIFADKTGLGIYKILYSSENPSDIDHRIYKLP